MYLIEQLLLSEFQFLGLFVYLKPIYMSKSNIMGV